MKQHAVSLRQLSILFSISQRNQTGSSYRPTDFSVIFGVSFVAVRCAVFALWSVHTYTRARAYRQRYHYFNDSLANDVIQTVV